MLPKHEDNNHKPRTSINSIPGEVLGLQPNLDEGDVLYCEAVQQGAARVPAQEENTVSTTEAAAFGLTKEAFDRLRQEAIKALQEAFNPRICLTIDEFIKKQTGSPIQLTSADMNLLKARYCEAVCQGAERLTSELSDAVGNRRGVGVEERQWILRQRDSFIAELTSPDAVQTLFAYVTSRFTIANLQEAEKTLSDGVLSLAGSGLLKKRSDEALNLALAQHGTPCDRLENKALETPTSVPPSEGGRPSPERVDPEVAKRRALVKSNPNAIASEMCQIFDREKVPLPPKWQEAGFQSWSKAYKMAKYRSRIDVLISKDKRNN